MLKTLDPRNNLQRASHKINHDIKEYTFFSQKEQPDQPKPPQKGQLQQVTLQKMLALSGNDTTL